MAAEESEMTIRSYWSCVALAELESIARRYGQLDEYDDIWDLIVAARAKRGENR